MRVRGELVETMAVKKVIMGRGKERGRERRGVPQSRAQNNF